ncbi:MAG TPA: fumarate/nitrate reduction transcriptional regulator Fnr [Rubrivivax sp.]|nr:fumarate/nitrate reduction transcriptional regulator Fnr [Rubrivivax sp.]
MAGMLQDGLVGGFDPAQNLCPASLAHRLKFSLGRDDPATPFTVTSSATVVPIKAAELKVACSSCNLRELCLPVGFSDHELERLDSLVATRRTVHRGDTLFRSGDAFASLFAVRTGFFKTRVSSEDGRDQVTGFQMAGELLGLDGIGSDRHTCDAVALEDSQVCVIPYGQLESLSRDFTDLQRQFHKIMSREIVRDHGVMLLLGSMHAEERLATFLLNLTQRLQARGFSPSSLVLRMTREEIGAYLGLKLETVSRCFSKFQDDGVLQVKQRQIHVLDLPALQKIVNGANG